MSQSIINFLELDNYINENKKYMSNKEYEKKVKELYELYEIAMNEE